MKRFIREATNQKWLSLICIPLVMMTMGAWSCSAAQQKTLTQYVGLAVVSCKAVAVIEPGIVQVCTALGVADTGLSAWVPGQSVPQNVIASLEAALTAAEAEYNISTKAKELIAILIVAIQAALVISGHGTASIKNKMKLSPYSGMTPQQLREKFNALAPSTGAPTI